jgi:radical SAM superfamily enzyme YgiQ (UPF0313 family)
MSRFPSYITVCLVRGSYLTPIAEPLEPPVALQNIENWLKELNNPVTLIDLALHNEPEKTIPRCSLYVFSVESDNYENTRTIAHSLKQRSPSARFVAQGPYAAMFPTEILEDGFDFVIAGEGGNAFQKIYEFCTLGRPVSRILAPKARNHR